MALGFVYYDIQKCTCIATSAMSDHGYRAVRVCLTTDGQWPF